MWTGLGWEWARLYVYICVWIRKLISYGLLWIHMAPSGTMHLNVSQHIESATHWVLKTRKNSRLQVVAAWPVSSAVNRCFGEYEANISKQQEHTGTIPVSLVSSIPIWGTLRYIRCGLSSYHKHGVGCIQLWMWLLHPWHRKISSCLIEAVVAVVCGKQPQFSGYLALWACDMWCNVVQWGSTCSTYWSMYSFHGPRPRDS